MGKRQAMLVKYAILIAVVIALVWAWDRFVKGPATGPGESGDGFDPSQFTIATTSQSAARAAKVLPTVASEDVSSLLGTLEEPPADDSGTELSEFLPEEQVSWVVTVSWAEPQRLHAKSIEEPLGAAWHEDAGAPILFGQNVETGRWSYARSGDDAEAVSDLKFAWSYYAAWRDAELAGEEEFQRRLAVLREGLAPWGACTLTPSVSPAEAAHRAQELRAIHGRLDKEALIVLLAPEGETFDGEVIWDVMLCLGLTWGDMDVFHWTNTGQSGDDSHFAVWTSTPPGYFFPELIAAGQVHTDDLAFGFRIPRCYHTEAVYTGMYRAAEYAQQRLGGTLVNIDGEPLDFEAELAKVRQTVQELKAVGLEPGSGAVMQLF